MSPDAGASGGRGQAVLVVGADDGAATQLQQALAEAGMDGVVLASAAHAREWLGSASALPSSPAGAPLEAVVGAIVELELPGGSGERLAADIREWRTGALVVGLTHHVTARRSIALLRCGVCCIPKPVLAPELAALFQARGCRDGRRRASAMARSRGGIRAGAPGSRGLAASGSALGECLAAYAGARGLSGAQHGVLQRYLEGMNDKEIAAASGCSDRTVYEHWRRMARKADTHYKGGVVADFHRFLRTQLTLADKEPPSSIP